MDENKEFIKVAKNPGELITLLILRARSDFLYFLQEYYKFKFLNAANLRTLAKVRASLITLYYLIRAALKRERAEKVEDIDSKLKEKCDFNELLEIFEFIEEWLDEKHITKPDAKIKYQGFDVETLSKLKGL